MSIGADGSLGGLVLLPLLWPLTEAPRRRRLTEGDAVLPQPVVPDRTIRSDLDPTTLHLTLVPLSDVAPTVGPRHGTLSVVFALEEVSFVRAAVGERTPSVPVPFQSQPTTFVLRSVVVRHGSLDHVTADVFPVKHPSVAVPDGADPGRHGRRRRGRRRNDMLLLLLLLLSRVG